MSLEKQIEELNANIVRLIDVMSATDSPKDEAPAAKPKAAKKKVAKKKATAKKTSAAKINYDSDIKPKVLEAIALAPEAREAVKELLEKYDAKNAKQIANDDLPEFLEGIEEIIVEFADDE